LKPGWINIDGMAKADLTLDLREPLPFRDGSCSMIYTEHFLEHVDYPEPALSLLKECHRVLQVDGVISIGVPDAGRSLKAYSTCDKEHFDEAKQRFHPPWCQTMMEHVNYTFRQGTEHRFAYDFETLAKALAQAGFREIARRPHDPEFDSRDPGGLYVRARH
jgi:predicted SAM-dependent methyltransferase